ncbi:uncharacterized protein [Montipora capricornis]|uniref:uncharacterized protein isoform X5 n=1 Tax=Montipora capricornis TaxID=246305 RepID=UPI0035F18B90
MTCGVISEHTSRMCTSRSALEPDDVIDVDSYEDGDRQLQALRDKLNVNRLSWEEESNVSTGEENSPAGAPVVKKKRKKKAKHKPRPR